MSEVSFLYLLNLRQSIRVYTIAHHVLDILFSFAVLSILE